MPTSWSDFKVDEFIKVMQGDKKNTSDKQRFILLNKLGEAYIEEEVMLSQIESVLHSYT